MNRFSIGVVISLLLIVILHSYSLFETYTILETQNLGDKTGNLVASGTARICINYGPEINLSDCNTTAYQGVEYTCNIYASDADNDTLTYNSSFEGTDYFTVTSWGYVEFTPNQSAVGNHTINLTVDDGQGCNNSIDTQQLSLEIININDPPKLVTNIPDQEFSDQSSVSFFLTTYFKDPDGDLMSFTNTITSNLNIAIDGSGLVTITSSECDYTESVIFFAQDPYNETNESNIVSYSVTCSSSGSDGNSQSSSGSSGGGGGGGTCIPELVCGTWEQCTPNGTQRKKCADLETCEDVSIKYLYRECKYTAHCYNGILDYDEAGIDCGGNDCDSCPTCFDGIINQDETGIDCGGSICEPCTHCTNGVQDFDETGIDCGGDECIACPTCNDGVQNGAETGVDCGGDCEPCTEFQNPALVGETNYIPAVVVGVLIILLTLLLTYRYYKTWLKKALAKAFYFFTGKRPKTLLLSEEDAKNLIRDLATLIKESQTHKKIPQSHVFDLMTVGRNYFVKALKVKQSINYEDLKNTIEKEGLTKELSTILLGFFYRIDSIERGEISVEKEEFEELAEELKEIIFVTSAHEFVKGMSVKREDIHKLKGKNRIYGFIHNSLFALEFGDVDEALRVYMQLIEAYDNLEIKHKSEVFKDVERLYKEILYAKSIN